MNNPCDKCLHKNSGQCSCDKLDRYEAYQQGRADERAKVIDELKNKLYSRARDKGIYASEYIAFIDRTFEQLKQK